MTPLCSVLKNISGKTPHALSPSIGEGLKFNCVSTSYYLYTVLL